MIAPNHTLHSIMTKLAVIAALTLILLIAASEDWRARRIPNRLVLSGLLLATMLHIALPAGSGFLAADFGGQGLLGALSGALIGIVAFLPFYLLHGFAAGDVKIMAMIGAFLGPGDILWGIFAVALAGGLQILAVLLIRNLPIVPRVFQGCFIAVGRPTSDFPERTRIPYGIAIAAGTILFIIFRASQTSIL